MVLIAVDIGGTFTDIVLEAGSQRWSGKVASGVWHALALEARGDRLTVIWEGKPIMEESDRTFTEAGKVGVWTKADSVTHFDGLTVTPLP